MLVKLKQLKNNPSATLDIVFGIVMSVKFAQPPNA